MVYKLSNIVEITREKIRFFDNTGNIQRIDLLECCRNWVEHFNSRNDFITWDGKPAPKITLEENTCVGERDWFDDKPYFEFFTNPKTRFEIHIKKKLAHPFNKLWRSRYHQQFHKVSKDLERVGWTTFDLS